MKLTQRHGRASGHAETGQSVNLSPGKIRSRVEYWVRPLPYLLVLIVVSVQRQISKFIDICGILVAQLNICTSIIVAIFNGDNLVLEPLSSSSKPLLTY
jgi:hypothetical protein